jgi:hypothetical protein
MNSTFIIDLWPLWIAGLVVFPLIAVLPQLKNIRIAIDKGEKEPNEVGKLFLSPGPLVISILFGIASFVCFVLFLGSVLVGITAAIKNLFA